MYFQGARKGLVLNVTNGNMIKEISGTPETDDWAGVVVEIYATETTFAGQTVDCIRVRRPNGPQIAEPPPSETPDGDHALNRPLPREAEHGLDGDIPF